MPAHAHGQEAGWKSVDLWGDDGSGPPASPSEAERRTSATFRDDGDGPRDRSRSRSPSRPVRGATTPLPPRLPASKDDVERGHRGEGERQQDIDGPAPDREREARRKKSKKKRRSKKSSRRATAPGAGNENADGPSFDAVAYTQSGDSGYPSAPLEPLGLPPTHPSPSSGQATMEDPSGSACEPQDHQRRSPAHRLADFDSHRDKSKILHKPNLLTRKLKQHGKKSLRPKDSNDDEGSVTSQGSGTTTNSVFTTTCIKLKGLKGYLNPKHPRGSRGKPKANPQTPSDYSSADNHSGSEHSSAQRSARRLAQGTGSGRSRSFGRRLRGHGFSRKRSTETSTATTCSDNDSPTRRLSASDFCPGSPRGGISPSDPEGQRDSSMPFIEEEEPPGIASSSAGVEEGSRSSPKLSMSMPNLAVVGEKEGGDDGSCGPRSVYDGDGAGKIANLSLPPRNASGGPTQVVGLPWQDGESEGNLHGMYSGPVNGLFRPHGEGKLVFEGNSFLTFYGRWADGVLVSQLLNDEEKRQWDKAQSPETSAEPDNLNGAVENAGPVSKESKQRRSRPRYYKLGDVARTPKDMVIHRSNHNAILSVSLLKEYDQAFLKRSNGLWTCCVLAERSLQPAAASSARWYAEHELGDPHDPLLVELEESMLFVINEDGATKIVKRRHWGKFVRCIQGQTVNVGE